MCRQVRAINRAQARFSGGPEKVIINPIWGFSRMWQHPRGGNSKLCFANYTRDFVGQAQRLDSFIPGPGMIHGRAPSTEQGI